MFNPPLATVLNALLLGASILAMVKMHVVKVERIVQEASRTLTYFFRAPFDAQPAQFVMTWIPGVDEVPMALSYIGEPKGVSVQALGDSTQVMHGAIKAGDRIGVRGPLGNTFDLSGKNYLIVCGGTGTASVITVAEALAAQGKGLDMVIGARTKDQIIFEARARRCSNLHIATDDGSAGFHGLSPTLAARLLDEGGHDRVITCGPERMMEKVIHAAVERDIAVQASIERYMKCGIGICDACALDGYLVCVDGPIFDGRELLRTEDFGKYRRDQCGRRVKL